MELECILYRLIISVVIGKYLSRLMTYNFFEK